MAGDALQDEIDRLIQFFLTQIATKNEDTWVNLSAFESRRLLSPVLNGTEAGRALLAQDCVLKRLSASLVHPDTELGSKYWEAVFEEATRIYGNTQVEIDSFQRVWITPETAVIYETSPTSDNHPDSLMGLDLRGCDFAFIKKSSLAVKHEQDHVALTKSKNSPDEDRSWEMNLACTSLFKDLILPTIEREVNDGRHFALMRQFYHSQILAVWYKKRFRDGPLGRYVDSSDPQQLLSISNINLSEIESKNVVSTAKRAIEPLTSYPEMEIAAAELDTDTDTVDFNSMFYETYMNLFKRGVYRCRRTRFDAREGQLVTRLYFSGGFNLGSWSNADRS